MFLLLKGTEMMIEILHVDNDVFTRNEGHLLSDFPKEDSKLMLSEFEREYESDCVILFGNNIVYSGECQFKMRKSQDGSPLLVFRVKSHDLGYNLEREN